MPGCSKIRMINESVSAGFESRKCVRMRESVKSSAPRTKHYDIQNKHSPALHLAFVRLKRANVGSVHAQKRVCVCVCVKISLSFTMKKWYSLDCHISRECRLVCDCTLRLNALVRSLFNFYDGSVHVDGKFYVA